MLYSIGKDSAVMLHLAQQGLLPGAAALPAAPCRYDLEVPRHVRACATGSAAKRGMELHRPHKPGGRRPKGINPFDHGRAPHRSVEDRRAEAGARHNIASTRAFGGARRDEEKSRAKERIFSFRSASHRWDPKRQRPELWPLYNVRKSPARRCGSSRSPTGPSSTSGNISSREGIEIVPLYLAAPRPMVERDGLLLMVDDERFRLNRRRDDGRCARVRFRTLGCYPLSRRGRERGGDTLEKVIQEMLLATTSDARAGTIDHDPARADGEEEAGGAIFDGFRTPPTAI